MSAPDQPNTPPSESKKPVRLMVIGDSDFAVDEYLQVARYLPIYQGGAQMLFNAIGWATEDEALTPVRTKTVGGAPDRGRRPTPRSRSSRSSTSSASRWPSSPSASCAGACAARRREAPHDP